MNFTTNFDRRGWHGDICRRFVAIACICSAFARGAGEAERRVEMKVPGGPTIEIRLPQSWEGSVFQPSPDLPPHLKVYAPDKSVLSLQVTGMRVEEGALETEEEVKQAVADATRRYVEGSVGRETGTHLVN